MIAQSASTARRQPSLLRRVTRLALTRGWAAPAGCRIRLARPTDLSALTRLLGRLDAALAARVAALVRSDAAAVLLTLASDGESRRTRAAVTTAAFRHQVADAFTGLSVVLVAERQSGSLAAVLVVEPAERLVRVAEAAGADRHQALTVAVAVAQVAILAVPATQARTELGTSLLRRAVRLYDQAGYLVIYGQQHSALADPRSWRQAGFELIAADRPVDLGPFLELPIIIRADPRGQLAIRWRLATATSTGSAARRGPTDAGVDRVGPGSHRRSYDRRRNGLGTHRRRSRRR